MKKYEYTVKNLDCANCANKIEVELSKMKDFENVSMNFGKLKLSFETDKTISRKEIEKIVRKIEPEVELFEYGEVQIEQQNTKTHMQILRLLIGILLSGIGLYVNLPENMSTIFIIVGYAILLYRTIKNAIKIFIQSKSIDENLLVAVSCIGAYLVGEHKEGLMVIILYEIGKILEDKAVNKTRKSITELMNIKPEYANLKIGNNIEKVNPKDVRIGDIVVIKQGEKIPLDGIVIKGTASLDTKSLTGESKLREIVKDEKALSGSIVIDGMIDIKVTEEYENSTVNKILELVENATDKKAKTETFVNKAAKIYTPVVLLVALIVGIFLPLISNVTYLGGNGSIYRALIFLVISCPCAIAISVPLSYFSGIGKSSKEGILVKGSDYLDSLKDIGEIVFDKTGTLTKGEFEIDSIETYMEDITKEKVLEYIVLGEVYSNHPIAKSIIKNAKIEIDESKIKNYKEISGKGISYKCGKDNILVGNKELVGKEVNQDNITKIYLKINNDLVGAVNLKDKIKDDTKQAIKELNKQGIKTKMFTGDNKDVAKEIAKEIEISEYKAGMLPDDKYKELEKIIKTYNKTGRKVAFVGDGINDSPVLARADIGISMGGIGAVSAIEASDIVIMTDSLSKISESIKISKKTCKIIKQNLTFAISIKILILILSTIGLAGMWQAVFADVGVTLITIINTLRILR